jgi:hypothetical protein
MSETIRASGGWCAPEGGKYDLMSATSLDALVLKELIAEMPSVPRGGITFPAAFDRQRSRDEPSAVDALITRAAGVTYAIIFVDTSEGFWHTTREVACVVNGTIEQAKRAADMLNEAAECGEPDEDGEWGGSHYAVKTVPVW